MNESMRVQFKNRTLIVADDLMRKVLELAARAAKTASPVLLCGESGTGKELVARYVHEKSARSQEPYISVNCAAIPEGLMEAELFGFERGAFTGAVFQKIGKFERANGGTLLLDEVSEMAPHLQAKLLRVLQENEIDRLGGRDSIPISTRIIATTNRDPMELIRENKFRDDLFYRLNVIRIDCPSLAGRPDAIRNLAEEFIVQSCQRQVRSTLKLSKEALNRLSEYHWPGNVRELQNTVERAVLVCDSDVLLPQDFQFLSTTEGLREASVRLSDLEKDHILGVLDASGGNRTHAARQLGISVRTLRNKLKDYTTG